MKKRSGFQVMLRLVGLVRPLAGFMALAILLGLVGHLCAAFLTVLGGYALAGALGLEIPFSLGLLFGGVLVFAVARGFLRYGEQACNHFIAFKLLALLREKVFQALRRLCPAKLEGKDRGNLIALITSDIELLEVFYAHTLSPIAIAALFTVALCLYIGSFHWALGLLALAAYAVVGVAVPLVTSRLSGDDGLRFRQRSGELSSFVLDSLRGLSETLQYGQGQRRLEEMDARTAALSQDEARMKRTAGRNQAVTNTVILVFDVAMLFAAVGLYQAGQVDFLVDCPFTTKFSQMSAEAFIEEIICGLFHARFVVVGTDFRFGYEKRGDVHMLADYAKRYGYQLFVIEKERYQDRIISSTYIKEVLREGDVEKAKEMLGYPYGVDGVVEHGKRLGRTLGFPTVNLHWPADKSVPPNGVYFSDVRIGGDRYHAISNVGVKPTVSDGERLLVESFLFGYQGDAYGKEILVEFLKYRRPERKFESVDELKRAVSQDLDAGRRFFRA